MKLLQLLHSICYEISGDVHLACTVPPVEHTDFTIVKAWVSCYGFMKLMTTLSMWQKK